MDKEEENRLIKNRIEFFMEKKNVKNNSQLAVISDLTQSSINSIMNRPSVPSIATLRKISNGLGISLIEFLDFYPYNVTPNTQKNNGTELENYIKNVNDELNQLKEEIKQLKKKTS